MRYVQPAGVIVEFKGDPPIMCPFFRDQFSHQFAFYRCGVDKGFLDNLTDFCRDFRDNRTDGTCTVFSKFVLVPPREKGLEFAARSCSASTISFSISGILAIASLLSLVNGTLVEAT